jgi:predicted HTH transcriptional regulator
MKVFISSVQSEFEEERIALRDYIQGNALLSRFFTVFIFEDTPAEDRKPDSVYLEEVADCDIYLGLFGAMYGRKKPDGFSATHIELNEATRLGKTRLIFRKNVPETDCEPEINKLMADIGSELVYYPFQDKSELIEVVYNALVTFLESKRLIVTGPFDESTTENATLEDISDDKMKEFVRRARNVRSFPMAENTEKSVVLKHLNLLTDNTPRNASILLFGKKPQNFFITSEVKCMMFYGNRITKPIPSYQIYKGTVFEMVDQAVDFVMSRIDCYVGEAVDTVQVPVEYEIPYRVVREAVVNAVAHRDYTSNASVQVMLFRNRLEIWNPGRLPSDLTISKLYAPHSSIPANPLIAEEMYRAGYIEKAGSGTLDMISRCREEKIPEPVFSVEPGKFIISFKRKSSLTGQVTPQVTQQVPSKLTPQEKVLLSSFQNRLIVVLTGKKSRAELMNSLNLRDRNSFTNSYLEPSIVSGVVRMTIPGSPNSNKQKYCLTDLGQKLRTELTGHDTDQVTGQVAGQVPEQLIRLLTIITGEMSRGELQEALKLRHRDSFVDAYLKPALELMLIEMTIPDKPTSSKQKYRLTLKGSGLRKKLRAEK